jgi:predicted phosphodiesterase
MSKPTAPHYVPPRRIAIMSCIHGNMEALETVLDDIARQDVDRILCLGDLVGYGPHPNEVIETLRDRDIRSVLGCWDEGIGLESGNCGCQFISDEDELLGEVAYGWTAEEVTQDHKAYLKALPQGVRMETPKGVIAFVHGSPRSTSEYLAESTHDLVLLERAAGADCQMLVCGHTHVPYVKQLEGTLRVTAHTGLKDAYYKAMDPSLHEASKEIHLSPKVIVNAGSVGEPRHGGPESTYVVIDTSSWDVSIRKVSYAVDRTVAAMRRKNLPESFMERLRLGQELIGKNKEITCAC